MNYVGLKTLRPVPVNTNVVFIFVFYCSFGRSISLHLLVLVTEM
jgi:hypothetical protein